MPPGTEQVITTAAATGRWEAVALAAIMLVVTGFLVYVVKAIMNQALVREERLAKRIDTLEDFIRIEMRNALNDSTKAMLTNSVAAGEMAMAVTKLIESLHTTRPCFATGDQQGRLVETIAARVASDVRARSHGHKQDSAGS